MTEQMPRLLIDVGNTAIKWRLANTEGLLDAGGSVSDVPSLCNAIEAEKWGMAGLASVASDAAVVELMAALTASGATAVHRAKAQSSCLGLVSSYAEPERMGVDRWLAMLAAHARNEGALCVIDAGTAVTVDLVAAEGVPEGADLLQPRRREGRRRRAAAQGRAARREGATHRRQPARQRQARQRRRRRDSVLRALGAQRERGRAAHARPPQPPRRARHARRRDARLRLRAARLRLASQPLEFAPQEVLPVSLRALGVCRALRARLEVTRVAARISGE